MNSARMGILSTKQQTEIRGRGFRRSCGKQQGDDAVPTSRGFRRSCVAAEWWVPPRRGKRGRGRRQEVCDPSSALGAAALSPTLTLGGTRTIPLAARAEPQSWTSDLSLRQTFLSFPFPPCTQAARAEPQSWTSDLSLRQTFPSLLFHGMHPSCASGSSDKQKGSL